MADCCSSYCKQYVKCEELGITKFMKVINKYPSELNKDWCESFEEKNSEE